MSQLYERSVSAGGRVTYAPHRDKTAGMVELDHALLHTLVATFVIGMLEASASQLPKHSRHGRELQRLENALILYAKNSAVELTEAQIDIMVHAWNSAMLTIQQRLQ